MFTYSSTSKEQLGRYGNGTGQGTMMHGESDGWFTFVAGHSSNPLHESEGKSGKKKEMLRAYGSVHTPQLPSASYGVGVFKNIANTSFNMFKRPVVPPLSRPWLSLRWGHLQIAFHRHGLILITDR